MDDRSTIYKILKEIIIDNKYSNIVLRNYTINSSISKNIYGILERKIELDFIISRYVKKIKNSLKIFLYIAIYQLKFLEKQDYAVINEVVNLAKKIKGRENSNFINAILRKINEDIRNKNINIEEENIFYSVTPFFLNELKKYYPIDYKTILDDCFGPKPVHLYILNNLENIKNVLKENNIKFREEKNFLIVNNYSHEILNEFYENGDYTILDYSTYSILDVMPDNINNIVDYCSAPGGKSILIKSNYPSCNLLCMDVNEIRLNLMKNNFKRFNFKNIDFKINDAANGYIESGLAILDLPCTGSGVLARKPEIRYRLDNKNTTELLNIQREIIDNICSKTKKGNYVILSTCSILNSENEQNVDYIAKKYGFNILKSKKVLPTKENEGFFCALIQKI